MLVAEFDKNQVFEMYEYNSYSRKIEILNNTNFTSCLIKLHCEFKWLTCFFATWIFMKCIYILKRAIFFKFSNNTKIKEAGQKKPTITMKDCKVLRCIYIPLKFCAIISILLSLTFS